jgi:hypothetical protein
VGVFVAIHQVLPAIVVTDLVKTISREMCQISPSTVDGLAWGRTISKAGVCVFHAKCEVSLDVSSGLRMGPR